MPGIVSSASTLERPAILRQVEIPSTDPEHYITGLYALNVQAPEGTSGDWHDVFHWQEGYDNPPQVTLGGSSAEVDTAPIYGGWGVYEGKDRLLAMGLAVPSETREVYLANHTRAILDLLYRSLTRWGRVLNLTGAATDWLDTYEQGVFLLEQAEHMAPHFPEAAQDELRRWIGGEAVELRAVYGR